MTLQAKTAPGKEAAITIQQQIEDTTYNTDFSPPKQVEREATSIEEVARILYASGGKPEYAAKCPAHEDNVESLSFKSGEKGIVYTCHAGCDFVRDLLPALKSRGINGKSSSGGLKKFVEREYDYVDSDGELLCQKIRYFPKDFRQRRPDGKGNWIWNLQGVKRVLYNLPAVAAAIKSKGAIYLLEGEKDADAVCAMDLCGTTYIDGASKTKTKWRSEYTQQLKGASQVYVIPDNDEAGINQAQLIHGELTKSGIASKLVKLPEGKDVSDWLLLGKTCDDFVSLCQQDARTPTAPNQNHESTAQTDELIKIGEVYELIRTASHNSYAEIEGRLHELDSEHVKNTLILQFYEKTGRVPSSDAVSKAVSLLKARVIRLPITKTFLRVGEYEGSIYLDLADDTLRVVEIDSDGWRITSNCPIKFLRPASMLPLAAPDESKGRLDPLASLIRARDEELILIRGNIASVSSTNRPLPCYRSQRCAWCYQKQLLQNLKGAYRSSRSLASKFAV